MGLKGGAYLIRADEADENAGRSEEEPGVDSSYQYWNQTVREVLTQQS